jgi:hypothetical protein
MVNPFIEKEDSVMRNTVLSSQRLSATLRFLGTVQSFEDLKFITARAPQILSGIVLEACEAIIWPLKENIKVINSPAH